MKTVVLSDGKRVPVIGHGACRIDLHAVSGQRAARTGVRALPYDDQKSDSQPGEHRRIFGDECGQFRMRGFELFNGLL